MLEKELWFVLPNLWIHFRRWYPLCAFLTFMVQLRWWWGWLSFFLWILIAFNPQESQSCSDLWRRETTTRRRSPGGWRIEDYGHGDDDDVQGDDDDYCNGDGDVELSMRQRQGGNHPAGTSGGLRIELRMLSFLPGKHRHYISKTDEDFVCLFLCCTQQGWPKLCRKIFKPKNTELTNTETQMPVQKFRCLTRLSPMLNI